MKYLIEATYTSEGAQGILKAGGSARRKVVEETTAAVNGKVEAFYFAFGERDAIMILDLPDNTAAAALAISVDASGAIRTKTTPLLTPEEVDAAAKQHVAFHPPG